MAPAGASHVAAAAHMRELIVFDDEGGVFDGCAAVAADEARALEDGDGRSRRRLAAGLQEQAAASGRQRP